MLVLSERMQIGYISLKDTLPHKFYLFADCNGEKIMIVKKNVTPKLAVMSLSDRALAHSMFKVSGFSPSIGGRDNISPCDTGFSRWQMGLEL